MRTSLIMLVAAIASVNAAGKYNYHLPQCAQACLIPSLQASKCGSFTNFQCTCLDPSYVNPWSECVRNSCCDKQSIHDVNKFGRLTCKQAGVQVPSHITEKPGPKCSASGTSSAPNAVPASLAGIEKPTQGNSSVGASANVTAGAQAASALPACALTCSQNALGSNTCTELTDFNCVCTNTAYQQACGACIAQSCDATEAAAAQAFGAATCAQAGITSGANSTASNGAGGAPVNGTASGSHGGAGSSGTAISPANGTTGGAGAGSGSGSGSGGNGGNGGSPTGSGSNQILAKPVAALLAIAFGFVVLL